MAANVDLELKPSYGVGRFVFGMKEAEVVEMIGEPDAKFVEEEEDKHELIYQYNKLKLRLTFYTTHEGKLGYIRTSNPAVTYNGKRMVGVAVDEVKKHVFGSLVSEWEMEEYEFYTTHLYEEKWLVLNSEYEEVTDIEMGVPFKDDDEYDWR